MPDKRWVQMPDGPWVLPDEESGIYVRQVAKLERDGHPVCFTVTGPGYLTTEHPSLEQAMKTAEAERYTPWWSQPRNDWPPMPEIVTAWPVHLFVKETTWAHWQGSATEIARLAKRGEDWMIWRFTPFQKLPRDAWHVFPGGPLRQQESVNFNYTVNTEFWAGGTTADGLRDEIEARRSLVHGVTLKASVTDRTWSLIGLDNPSLGDIFDQAPLAPARPRMGPPGVSTTVETVSPPMLIELHFQTDFPAVRLRTIAPTAQQCINLHDHMAPHVDAGKRDSVWDPELGGAVGTIIGLAAADALLLVDANPPPWTILVPVILGAVGWVIGVKLVRWTFPPLELIEAWERPRWSVVKTMFWQAVLFMAAAVSIVLAILGSRPSTHP
jgi:hypothetical protein